MSAASLMFKKVGHSDIIRAILLNRSWTKLTNRHWQHRNEKKFLDLSLLPINQNQFLLQLFAFVLLFVWPRFKRMSQDADANLYKNSIQPSKADSLAGSAGNGVGSVRAGTDSAT